MNKVIIIEFRNILHATRLLKEAQSLASSNYKVLIIGYRLTKNLKVIDSGNNLNYYSVRMPFYPEKGRLTKILGLVYFGWSVFFRLLHEDVDIFHLHDLKLNGLIRLMTKFKRAKLVYDAHELHSEKRSIRNKLDGFLRIRDINAEKKVIRSASLVIQANEQRAHYFASFYGTELPLVIENHAAYQIPNVDMTRSIRDFVELRSKKIVVFTGNITLGNNQRIDKVIEALTMLEHDVILCCVGKATQKEAEKIKKLVNHFSLSERVFIIPPVPSEDVVTYISEADVSVIPIFANCLNSKYSALNKFSQSLMAGLPLVCTDYEDLRIRIKNNPVGEVGELFDVLDSRSIANSINICLNKEKNEIYRKNAREVAREIYNWEVEEVKLLYAYKKLSRINVA